MILELVREQPERLNRGYGTLVKVAAKRRRGAEAIALVQPFSLTALALLARASFNGLRRRTRYRPAPQGPVYCRPGFTPLAVAHDVRP